VLRVTRTGDGGGWKVWPIDEPLATQTTRQDLAVCTPMLAPAGGPRCAPSRADEPLGTVLTRDHRGLITPILASAGGSAYAGKVRRIDALLNTVETDNRQCLVSPVMVTLRNHVAPVRPDAEPLAGLCAGGTHHALVAALLCTYYGNSTVCRPAGEGLGCVTTLDRHALVSVLIDGVEFVIIDILFRMLRPRELAAAMGFPAGYQWPASQRDATRLIGNAVHVDVAAALIGASLPRGRVLGEGRAAA
jgi:DNA (cytosine-5)-methyltransferase 1